MSDLQVVLTITPLNVTGAAAMQFHHAPDSWIPSLQPKVEFFHRVGDDATGAQTMGTVADEKDFPCSAAFTTKALAIAFIAQVEALKVVVCQFADPWGRTIPRVRVNAARARPVAARGASIGGVPTIYRVDCMLRVERLTDT